jgi:hypothetical protein
MFPNATAGSVQASEIIEAAQKAAAEADLLLDMPALLSSVDGLGPEMFEQLSPTLYVAFWTLELQDICFATDL